MAEVSGEICRKEPRKIIVVRVFIRIMLAYSARKNKAKGPAAYSTLNPETSSDSPSVRSNGARLVSARVETKRRIAKGQAGIISQVYCCVTLKADIVKPPTNNTAHKIIRAKEIS